MRAVSIPCKSNIVYTGAFTVGIKSRNIIYSIEDKAKDSESCGFGDISSSTKYTSEYGGDYELWNQISFQKDSTALSIPDFENEFRRKQLWQV